MPHFNSISDGLGRTMTVAGSDPYTTSNIGVYPLAKFLREFNLLDLLKERGAPSLPMLKCRGGLSQYQKFLQRLVAVMLGKCKIQPFPRRIPKFPWNPAQQCPKWH